MPRTRKASRKRAPCQPGSSVSMTTSGIGAPERRLQQFFVDRAGMESLAALQRGHGYRRRRKQLRIDAIKIIGCILEHARKRLAVVAGSARRQIGRKAFGF